MKKISSYLNAIGFSLIIILMVINENKADESIFNSGALGLIILILGICMAIINIKRIISK
ncbi:hypothetical protein [Clostridium cibarium]|uniref:Uncharacterized protein n=1 Tax=Clostridium cibarium TaxID=2762247 RepID=A0ABR8PSG2_9CLOT|nr:hypothetical protein [Clostridium cibarium]MBD7911034.1 hypothetical protein [Clostridium cibarium]